MIHSKSSKDEARTFLLAHLKPGDTVYTQLNHSSRSGMSRSITPLILRDNEPFYLTSRVATLCDYRLDRYEGLIVTGCGMDMGFSLVYNLSYALFPNGFGVVGERRVLPRQLPNGKMSPTIRHKRPQTWVEAERMVAQGWKFYGRNGDTSGWDSNGGYALQHRWI